VNNKLPLIAIVDDDPDVRRALRRLIGSAGFAVETFSSGEEFLRSLEQHQPACIVLDLHMPEVSGFDVQMQITHSHASIPVVILTGHDTPEARERALKGGAACYLCKPIDDETLLAGINAAIAR
jgi:FixJ family two-component response regulator